MSPAHSRVRGKPTLWSASSEVWRSMKVARDSFLTSGLRSGCGRRGSWMLEVQIAFVVLGIGLAGLCPFVVMQLRQLVNLESRLMATPYIFTVSAWQLRTVLSNQHIIRPILPCIGPACTPRSALLLLSGSLE